MKKIGFLISDKENELRRAIVLEDIKSVHNKSYIYLEKGYGDILGYSDEEFIKLGCNIMEKEKILLDCDILCDPKIGDAKYLSNIKNKTIFGWLHATQNFDILQKLVNNKLTAIAWEKMYKDGVHIFYMNNQSAGKAGILHASIFYGEDLKNKNVAVLGRGNTAKGCIDILSRLGAKIEIFGRKDEEKFVKKMNEFDMITNCIMWDIMRKDHIISKQDLTNLKRNCMIVDISCDKNGAIETSIPTTIESPVYAINGIRHYVVDHTPSILYREASKEISKEVSKFLDELIEDSLSTTLKDAIIIEKGKIVDEEIINYRKVK